MALEASFTSSDAPPDAESILCSNHISESSIEIQNLNMSLLPDSSLMDNPRGIQLKKVKKEIFFLGLSFLLFSSFPRHSPKVDKVFFFLPRFLSFLYVFNFFNFLGEKKTFCSRRRNKSGIVRQVYDEIYKIGTLTTV